MAASIEGAAWSINKVAAWEGGFSIYPFYARYRGATTRGRDLSSCRFFPWTDENLHLIDDSPQFSSILLHPRWQLSLRSKNISTEHGEMSSINPRVKWLALVWEVSAQQMQPFYWLLCNERESRVSGYGSCNYYTETTQLMNDMIGLMDDALIKSWLSNN